MSCTDFFLVTRINQVLGLIIYLPEIPKFYISFFQITTFYSFIVKLSVMKVEEAVFGIMCETSIQFAWFSK